MRTHGRTFVFALALLAASCRDSAHVPREPEAHGPDDAEVVDTCAADDLSASGGSCDAPSITVSVQDERGFPLAADSVAFIAPGCHDPVPCRPQETFDPLAPHNGFVCRVPEDALDLTKSPLGLGLATLSLVVGKGDAEYRLDAVPVMEGELPNPTCQAFASPRLPLAPCIDVGASAIEGTLVGTDEGAVLRVFLSGPFAFDGDAFWSRGRNVECEVQGTRYRCPPLGFDYTHAHLLTVVHDDKVLFERSVTISVDACNVLTTHYDLERACDIGVWFGIDGRDVDAEELTVSVEATETSPAASCTRAASDALVYRCPTGVTSANAGRRVQIANSDGTTLSATTSPSSPCGVSGTPFSRTAGAGRITPPESPTVRLSPEQLRMLGLQ